LWAADGLVAFDVAASGTREVLEIRDTRRLSFLGIFKR
jgi:hypothetical protein